MAESKDDEIAQPNDSPHIILGTMEFGRRLNEKDSHEIMTAFLKSEADSNKSKELDSAFMYQGGKTESIMGKINKTVLTPNNALIASKAMPRHEHGLSDKGIRAQLQVSLSRLQTGSIDIFYLHWPDHKTEIEESLKTMNDLYQKGKFKRFGLSNYSAWQVIHLLISFLFCFVVFSEFSEFLCFRVSDIRTFGLSDFDFFEFSRSKRWRRFGIYAKNINL